MENNGGAAAAPTGCYKCGRPGHWSRDCPSSNPNSNNPISSKPSFPNASKPTLTPYQKHNRAEKPKKAPKSRPKLTTDLLLSKDGLGFVLRHFPRAFKYKGRGHEARGLRNLLGLYAEWHSRLIPYYSFNQFVHKVEQVGASKRVKVCLRELRDRISNGEDPTKLHEPPAVHDLTTHEQDTVIFEEPSFHHEDTSLPDNETGDFQNNMLHQINGEVTNVQQPGLEVANASVQKEVPHETAVNDNSGISEELRARIEANRLKALERAAARRRASATGSSGAL